MIKHFCVGGRYIPYRPAKLSEDPWTSYPSEGGTIEDIYLHLIEEDDNVLFQLSFDVLDELADLLVDYYDCKDKEKFVTLYFSVEDRESGGVEVFVEGNNMTWFFTNSFLLEMEEFLND